MELLATALPVLVLVSVGLIVLALALDSTIDDTLFLFRQPGLLLRSVASMYVVVPVVAAFVVSAFRLTPVIALAIILMSVSPIPPVLPVTQLRVGGSQRYVIGLLVAVSVLAIVLVPLALVILSRWFTTDAYLPPAGVARVVFMTVLLPLAVGIAIRRAWPAFATRITPAVSRTSVIALVVFLLPILAASWARMIALVGNGSVLAIAVVCGIGLASGDVLGRPDPANRSSLAFASMMRHPGIALAIAKANFPDAQAGAAILLYLLVGLVLGVPYRRFARKRTAAATPLS